MTCDIYVGQRLVCIADYGPLQSSDWCREFGLVLPEKGGIYTVRELELVRFPDGERLVGLLLVEIVNPPVPCTKAGGPVEDERDILPNRETAFDPRDFRPLVERGTDTDMATLHRLLEEAPAGKTAEVPA